MLSLFCSWRIVPESRQQLCSDSCLATLVAKSNDTVEAVDGNEVEASKDENADATVDAAEHMLEQDRASHWSSSQLK